jgi:hypothetical protein
VEWIFENINKISWRRDVIGKTTNRGRMSMHVILLPLSKERDDEVSFEFLVENLREEVEI